MSDESDLLAAIVAHPDEDTPRLMYADWLDEHGQPERAEFIRIQCASDADEEADERAAELEDRNRVKWLVGLPQFVRTRWEFRRGFPEHLDAHSDSFVERFDAYVRVPWLRSLSLRNTGDLSDFVNRSWNPRWVELEIYDSDHRMWTESTFAFLRVRPLVNLAKSFQSSQLRLLRLSISLWPSEVIHALATSPHLDRLERLCFAGDRDDPWFAPLRERFGDRLVID